MPVEHEHKYAIQYMPDECNSHYNIAQFYFAHDTERHLVSRVRSMTFDELPESMSKNVITHKIGKGERVQEVEYPVAIEVAKEMEEFFKIGKTIRKVRHIKMIEGLKWEIDVFENGLIVAELENPPSTYGIPQEFGAYVDVTNQVEYKNWHMAFNGVPEFGFYA